MAPMEETAHEIVRKLHVAGHVSYYAGGGLTFVG